MLLLSLFNDKLLFDVLARIAVLILDTAYRGLRSKNKVEKQEQKFVEKPTQTEMVNKSRDKDVDRDSSDSKKHRKTNSTSSTSSNASEMPSIKTKIDVYAVCMLSYSRSLLKT